MSERDDAILACIIAYKTANDGNSPTLRTLMQATGISTTSLVAYHLRRLERAGKITLQEGARGICVTGGRWEVVG